MATPGAIWAAGSADFRYMGHVTPNPSAFIPISVWIARAAAPCGQMSAAPRFFIGLTPLTLLVKRFILLRTGFSDIRALESRSAVVQERETSVGLVMKQKQEEISLNGLHV